MKLNIRLFCVFAVLWLIAFGSNAQPCQSSGASAANCGTYVEKSNTGYPIARYFGELQSGLPHGVGVTTYLMGTWENYRYFGEYRKGKQQGKGIFYTPDGRISESGLYEDGVLVIKQYIDPKSFTAAVKNAPEAAAQAKSGNIDAQTLPQFVLTCEKEGGKVSITDKPAARIASDGKNIYFETHDVSMARSHAVQKSSENSILLLDDEIRWRMSPGDQLIGVAENKATIYRDTANLVVYMKWDINRSEHGELKYYCRRTDNAQLYSELKTNFEADQAKALAARKKREIEEANEKLEKEALKRKLLDSRKYVQARLDALKKEGIYQTDVVNLIVNLQSYKGRKVFLKCSINNFSALGGNCWAGDKSQNISISSEGLDKETFKWLLENCSERYFADNHWYCQSAPIVGNVGGASLPRITNIYFYELCKERTKLSTFSKNFEFYWDHNNSNQSIRRVGDPLEGCEL
jgi:hypothetical protein